MPEYSTPWKEAVRCRFRRRFHVASKSPAIDVLDGDGVEVDSVEAADIDGGHPVAGGVAAFAVGMNAALGTEAVFDDVFVERIGGGVLLRCQQPQAVPRHEPEQGSFPLADRAVAGHGAVDVAFHLEEDVAAMAAAGVFHVCSSVGWRMGEYRPGRPIPMV